MAGSPRSPRTCTIGGMIGGQVMDLEAERVHPDARTLEYIHRSKTARCSPPA